MKYIVINADIINSKNTQFKKENIEENIKLLNSDLANDILVGFSILRGDEIQGIVDSHSDVFKVIRHLILATKPFKVRIGVGIGDIYNIPKNTKSSWELNGEAFFKAREAIESFSKSGQPDVVFVSENKKLDKRINLFYSFVTNILNGWSLNTFKIIKLAESGFTHEEIAEKIYSIEEHNHSIKNKRANVTQQIIRSQWYKIKETEDVLNEMLREGGNE